MQDVKHVWVRAARREARLERLKSNTTDIVAISIGAGIGFVIDGFITDLARVLAAVVSR
jgi:hypothetical protein